MTSLEAERKVLPFVAERKVLPFVPAKQCRVWPACRCPTTLTCVLQLWLAAAQIGLRGHCDTGGYTFAAGDTCSWASPTGHLPKTVCILHRGGPADGAGL